MTKIHCRAYFVPLDELDTYLDQRKYAPFVLTSCGLAAVGLVTVDASAQAIASGVGNEGEQAGTIAHPGGAKAFSGNPARANFTNLWLAS